MFCLRAKNDVHQREIACVLSNVAGLLTPIIPDHWLLMRVIVQQRLEGTELAIADIEGGFYFLHPKISDYPFTKLT